MVARDATTSLYYYQPNVPAAFLSAIALSVLAAVYLWRLTQHQAWCFWAMYIGLFMELIGFVARAISVRNPTQINPFLVSYLAIMLAPTLVAAACYATFGRIVWWVTPPKSLRFSVLWCPTRFVTPFFVLFDLSSFFIQLLGASAVGTAYSSEELSAEQRDDQAKAGLAALKLGFALQLVCFGLFAVVGTRFLAVSRYWTQRPLRYTAPLGANWTLLLWAVNAATIAITIRAVYRMIEFFSHASRDHPSYLLLHEWPFWAFDAVPVICVFVLFAVVYPGHYLPPKFLAWWLSTRKLRNEAKSLPPAYNEATILCLSTERGSEQC